jgi:regulatory protein
LLGVGLLDDALFSQQWIESRDRARPRGETALKRELRLRGVDPSVIAAALAERRTSASEFSAGDPDPGESAGPSDPDEVAARRLIDRRRRDLDRVVDPRKRRGRAYALLARNGFSPEIASRLSAELVRDEASVDPPS